MVVSTALILDQLVSLGTVNSKFRDAIPTPFKKTLIYVNLLAAKHLII